MAIDDKLKFPTPSEFRKANPNLFGGSDSDLLAALSYAHENVFIDMINKTDPTKDQKIFRRTK